MARITEILTSLKTSLPARKKDSDADPFIERLGRLA